MNYQYKLLTALVSMQLFAMDGKNLWDVKACNASEDLASTTMNVESCSTSEGCVTNVPADIRVCTSSEDPCVTGVGIMEGPCASASADYVENGEQVGGVAHYLSQVEAVDTNSAHENTLPSLHERESANNAQNHSVVGAQEQIMAQRKSRQNELAEKIALQAAELRKLEQSDMSDNEDLARSEVINSSNVAFLSLQFEEIEDRADVAVTLLFGFKNSLLHMHNMQNTDEPSQRQNIENSYQLEMRKWAMDNTWSKEKIDMISVIKNEEAKEWNGLYDSLNTLNKMYRKECDKNNNERFEKLEQMLLTLTEDKIAQQSKISELETQNAEQTKKVEDIEKRDVEKDKELRMLAEKNDEQKKAIDSLVNDQEEKLAELKDKTKEIVGLCMKAMESAIEEQTDKSVDLENKYTEQSEKLSKLTASTREAVEMNFKKLIDLESESKEVANSHAQKMEKQSEQMQKAIDFKTDKLYAHIDRKVSNIYDVCKVDYRYENELKVAKLMLKLYEANVVFPKSYRIRNRKFDSDDEVITKFINQINKYDSLEIKVDRYEKFVEIVRKQYFSQFEVINKSYYDKIGGISDNNRTYVSPYWTAIVKLYSNKHIYESYNLDASALELMIGYDIRMNKYEDFSYLAKFLECAINLAKDLRKVIDEGYNWCVTHNSLLSKSTAQTVKDMDGILRGGSITQHTEVMDMFIDIDNNRQKKYDNLFEALFNLTRDSLNVSSIKQAMNQNLIDQK